MKNLFLVILSLVFVNASFNTSMFLKNIKSIKKIYISYEDAHGNKERKSINMNNKIILDELLIFNEEKRQTSLKKIALSIPDKINSIEIEYVNKNNKNMNKFMGIALNDRGIIGDNIYIYQDKDFNYKKNNEKVDVSSLFKKINKPKKINKKPIARKNTKQNTTKTLNFLDIIHFDKGNYIDILIKNCGNKNDNICNEVKRYNTNIPKKVIFYFNINRKNKRENNVSPNIKKIQVAYDTTRKPTTWLVIETKKEISKVEKMYYENEEFSPNKSMDMRINNEQLSYRLHIK